MAKRGIITEVNNLLPTLSLSHCLRLPAHGLKHSGGNRKKWNPDIKPMHLGCDDLVESGIKTSVGYHPAQTLHIFVIRLRSKIQKFIILKSGAKIASQILSKNRKMINGAI